MVADEFPIEPAVVSPNMTQWLCLKCGTVIHFKKRDSDSTKLQMVLDHICNLIGIPEG